MPFTFALLLLAMTIGELARRSCLTRWVALLGLFLVVAGNLSQTKRASRGHYFDAVQLTAAQTHTPLITVTTERDQEFRVRPILAFYERYLPPGKKLAFNQPLSADVPAPQWLIINTRITGSPIAPNGLEVIPNHRWVFVAEFPYCGLSGWAWQLYRVEE